MISNGIEHKLRVFISSRCGGKYTIVRKALKAILQATGLIEVYAFETEPASSMDTQSAYLDQVEQSNLCIFIVDNEDDITPPVWSEVRTARDRRIRQIFIFCDETKKEPTLLQSEIKESLSQKYSVTHVFSDIVDAAYTSVMQDILAVYKRKERDNKIEESEVRVNGRLKEQGSSDITQAFSIPINFELISRHVLNVIKEGIIYIDNNNNENISDLDNKIANHLQFILGKRAYDHKEFIGLSKEVLSCADERIKPLLELRYKAQTYYYSCDYDKCLEILQKALILAMHDTSIPGWLALDLAIDIRHLCWKNNEIHNFFSKNNAGQKFLDESTIPVYFPYLDRQAESFYQKITKRYYKELNKPPELIEFGGIEGMFADLSNIFYVAVLYGSIIQTAVVRNRMIEVLSMLTTLYDDYEYVRELIRLEIINADSKALDWILRSNIITEEKLSYTDFKYFMDCLENVPDPILRKKGQFCLIAKFGYYLEDSLFENLFEELYSFSMKWVKDDAAVVNLGTYIIEFFRGTIYRAEQEKILQFIEVIFSNGFSRYYMDVLKLLQELDIAKLSKDSQRRLRGLFYDLINGSDKIYIDNSLCHAFIYFCKNTTVPFKRAEKCFKTKASKHFRDAFDLELAEKKGNDLAKFIPGYLEMACSRDKEQGIDGKYTGYAFEPHDVIYNILKYNDLKISQELINQIIQSVLSTLSSAGQTVKAKRSALKLLQLLYFSTMELELWDDVQKDLLKKEESYAKGAVLSFFTNESNDDLKLAFNLLCCTFDRNRINRAIDGICSVDINTKVHVVHTLAVAACFLADSKKEKVDNSLLAAVLNLSLIMSQNKDKKIRLPATKCLIELVEYSDTNNLAIMGLSRVMDNGTAEEKICILRNLQKFDMKNNLYRKQIINKGLADNNYVARSVAKQIC